MSEVVQTIFNYASLAPDTRTIVEAATARLHVLERKTGEQIVEIGKILINVKEDIPHGQFLPWLEAEFGWSERTAQKFMIVADHFKSAHYADLNIAPSALYILASNTVSDEVRAEFIAKAEAGERVTHKAVKDRTPKRNSTNPSPVASDPEDDEPLSDFAYERVDPYTGEVLPNDAPAPRPAAPKPVQERRPPESTQDLEARANAVAADICTRHGFAQALRIADAIRRQAGLPHE